ncbi:MAG: phage terminase large subunit [Gammaproteobacteria bacterium]|nr:phage terminase large subunit [Gammaproteobacteria bacterium]
MSIDLKNESPDFQAKFLSKARLKQEKDKILESPAVLAKILDYSVAKHHQKIFDFVERDDSERSLILAPRGAGKSSIITIVYVLWLLLKDPNLRILVVSNSQGQSTGFLREIKQHCERNPILKFLFGDLVGDKWSEIEIDLGIRTKFVKESNVSAYGIFGALVGRHYDIIIMDDLVSQEIAQSPTQRAKLESWVGMSLMPTLEPKGKVIVIGTRYHNSDLYGNFIKGKYKDNYIQIQAIDDDGNSYWPEYFPIDILESIKKEIGTFIFNAQYQNDPHDMAGGLFQPQWLDTWWDYLSDGCICIPEREAVYIRDLKIAQGFDQAVGMGEMHDFNAHVTIGQDQNIGLIYVLEIVKARLTFTERKNLITDKYDEWVRKTNFFTTTSVEALGFQSDLCNEIMRERPDIPLRRDVPRVDKFTRFTPVATLAENYRLYLGPGQEDLYDELVMFPGFDHDDIVDALEKAIQGLTKQMRITAKPLGM